MIFSAQLIRLIKASLLEVSSGYFGGLEIWNELGINKKILLELQVHFKDEKNIIHLSPKDLSIIKSCVEVTMRKLGEEDMHIHTGITWEEANRLFNELELLK